MALAFKIIIGFVALEHLYIMYMEMFAWTTLGRKTFKGALADHLFEPTRTLAANQGLYNGFLAAGLLWSFFITDAQWSANVALFFLSCVAVAGIYGALTASMRIFFVQALPALIGMALFFLKG
jgi:putative membrane protein